MGGFYGVKRLNGAPLVNSDGTVSIYCRQCGREVARRLNSFITSISKCAVCQGYPEENVVAPYVQQNWHSAPIPRDADKDYLYLYGGLEDIQDGMGLQPVREERIGTVKTVFRALGNFLRASRSMPKTESPSQVTPESKAPESKKVAIRKRRKSIFSEPVEE